MTDIIPNTKKWNIAPRISSSAETQLELFHPIIRQLLFNRGYATYELAQSYLNAEFPNNTDPLQLSGMEDAISIISHAIRHSKKITIYGDYDVDGVTATALLTESLNYLGVSVQGYIPNRFEEGYGLNIEALDQLKSEGTDVIITVDCGIRSIDEVEHARNIGLEMIVTDHHHPLEEIPPANAIVNPKLSFETYPDKELAGVGVAYKLACALLSKKSDVNTIFGQLNSDNHKLHNYVLDLVTLGTIADLAPLIGENRALVRKGLIQLNPPKRQGIQSLINIAGLTNRPIQSSDIGYILGPRLNAAGRLDSALAALELLLTNDSVKAGQLAQKLDNQNRERQQLTSDLLTFAEELYSQQEEEPYLVFIAHQNFNQGVIGLVASRLVEKFYKPAIVAYVGETFTRGSCRSIPEFHITDALDKCSDLMEHHGGHAAAAGFTAQNDKLSELFYRLNEIAKEKLSSIDLRPTLHADMEIPLCELKPDLLKLLELLQPIGYRNPDAVFVSRNLKVNRAKTVGQDDAHLRLTVTDGIVTYNAIAFRQGYWLEKLPSFIDIIYTFEKNTFNENQYLQLNVKDIRPTDVEAND